ncbi:hypothetical protein ACFL3D_04420 [Candidatus Omnitrophota bacterium]
MKKILSLCIVGILVVGLALTGCEKKSDTEKAFDSLKKDVEGIGK